MNTLLSVQCSKNDVWICSMFDNFYNLWFWYLLMQIVCKWIHPKKYVWDAFSDLFRRLKSICCASASAKQFCCCASKLEDDVFNWDNSWYSSLQSATSLSAFVFIFSIFVLLKIEYIEGLTQFLCICVWRDKCSILLNNCCTFLS